MTEPQVEITVMSDGTIVVTGPEAVAANLKSALDAFFTARGLAPSNERIDALRQLLMDEPDVHTRRFQ